MKTFIESLVPILNFFKSEIFVISGRPISFLTIAILVSGIIISIALGRWTRKLTSRIVTARGAVEPGLAYSLGVIAQYFVTTAGILFALDNIGISLSALAAFGAILTVGIGFGLQNIAQNFISGIILLLERPVQRGDFIIIGDTVGTVHSISMRATRILSRDNVAIIVPNSKLISETVINQSASRSAYRARVAIGIAYGSDTELARKTLISMARSRPEILSTPPPQVFFRNFGESSLDFELVIWLEDPGPEPFVTSELRFLIDAEFRRIGITIPFPQRDLHIKTSL